MTRRGYTEDFRAVDGRLRALGAGQTFAPADLVIREFHRFGGISDPDDMAIVYAIESKSGAVERLRTRSASTPTRGGGGARRDPDAGRLVGELSRGHGSRMLKKVSCEFFRILLALLALALPASFARLRLAPRRSLAARLMFRGRRGRRLIGPHLLLAVPALSART